MAQTDYNYSFGDQGPNMPAPKRFKERLVLRKGASFIVCLLSEVVLFYSEDKIVYALDCYGQKYITDKNLAEWEEALPPERFFRANRQSLVQGIFVKGYRPYMGVKLLILFENERFPSVVVSQVNAPRFKKWLESF